MNIGGAQAGVGTAATVGTEKLCGILFNAGAITSTTTATVCSWRAPYRVGVHFDDAEAIAAPGTADDNDAWGAIENAAYAPATTGAGIGHAGFYLAYWQSTC